MSQSTSQQPVVPLADAPQAQTATVEDGPEEATVSLGAVPAADAAAVPPGPGWIEANPVTFAALYAADPQSARLYAADVLRMILNEAPTPSSIMLHTKDYEPTPRIEVHLYRDADLEILHAYQALYGGEVVREVFESGAVRSSFAAEVFGVPLYVSTVLLAKQPKQGADAEPEAAAVKQTAVEL